MSDQNSSKSEAIAKSVEKIADSKGLAEIGKGLGAGLVALAGAIAVASIFIGGFAAINWDGHLHSQSKCYELQEISGDIYKVNTCTGKIELFKKENNNPNETVTE